MALSATERVGARALSSAAQRLLLSTAILASDLLVTLAAFLFAQFSRFRLLDIHANVGGTAVSYSMLSIGLAAAWVVLLPAGGRGRSGVFAAADYVARDIVAATFLMATGIAFYMALSQSSLSRRYLLVALPTGLLLLLGERMVWRSWLLFQRRRGRLRLRAVLVGGTNWARHADGVLRSARSDIEFVGKITLNGSADAVADDVTSVASGLSDHAPDIVFVGGQLGQDDEVIRQLSWLAADHDAELILVPQIPEMGLSRLNLVRVGNRFLLRMDAPYLSGPRYAVKRLFDVSSSALALLVLWPVLLGLALAVRLDSSGPVIFRQERIGRDHKPFTIYKFRTMVVDAEHRRAELLDANDTGGLLFKIKEDPRVTRVGRFLRRYSLDELPQLINVLQGDMSLVGPRPPLRSEVHEYTPLAHRRLALKPGITGLWQVGGRSDLSWESGLALDLYYVENWSLIGDALVLLRTARAVFGARGAY